MSFIDYDYWNEIDKENFLSGNESRFTPYDSEYEDPSKSSSQRRWRQIWQQVKE